MRFSLKNLRRVVVSEDYKRNKGMAEAVSKVQRRSRIKVANSGGRCSWRPPLSVPQSTEALAIDFFCVAWQQRSELHATGGLPERPPRNKPRNEAPITPRATQNSHLLCCSVPFASQGDASV